MFNNDQDFSFKDIFSPLVTLFSPLTNAKAISIINILGIIVFCNSLFNTFVLDDNKYIINNTSIHVINPYESFVSTSNLFNNIFDAQYRPIPALYFSLLYVLFTTMPFFYHLLSLLLHLTNTILVFFLLKHFFNSKLALFLSLFFLVHPLQVESISYMAAADNPLFFLFGISALLLSMKSHIDWKRMVIICSFLLLSLLTKETAIIFIFLILLYRVLFQKSQRVFFCIGAVCTVALYAFIRLVVVGVYFEPSQFSELNRITAGTRHLAIPAVLFYYIKNFFYPSHLGIEQDWAVKTMDFPHFYFPLCVDILFFIALLLIGWFIATARKKMIATYLFFLAWVVVGLIVHSQLFPLDVTVADRFMYLPIVGFVGMVGVSIQSIKHTSKNMMAVGVTLGMIVISLLSFKTITRNMIWSNETTLYATDVDTYENGILAQEGWLGQAWIRASRERWLEQSRVKARSNYH